MTDPMIATIAIEDLPFLAEEAALFDAVEDPSVIIALITNP